MCRKVARGKSEKKHFPTRIVSNTVEKYLGPPQFFMTEAEGQDEVGVATAIAWTENGGEIMPVEVLIMDGKGNLQITGQIGDVMQESAQAALSYLKSRADNWKLTLKILSFGLYISLPEAQSEGWPQRGNPHCYSFDLSVTERGVSKDVCMTVRYNAGKVLR
jgi:ATP-dependent Lon protease